MTVISQMTSDFLRTYQMNLGMLEEYYLGDQPAKMFSEGQKHNADFTRLYQPVNLCNIIINEPIGYLTKGLVNIKSSSHPLESWASSWFERRFRNIMADIVRYQGLFGEVYAYLWFDGEGLSRGVKVRAIPPVEGGVIRIEADFAGEDEQELSEAIIYYTQALPGRRSYKVYRLEIDHKNVVTYCKTDAKSNFEKVSTIPNPLEGVLPVVPFFNNGVSDLIPVLGIQDDLNKLHFDIRLSREYTGFPMLSTDSHDVAPDFRIGPDRLFTGGTLTSIPAGDLSPMLRQHEMLVGMASTLGVSLALSDRSGGNLSGVALQYLQQQFESKLQEKAVQLSIGIKNLLRAAARYTASSEESYTYETRFLEKDEIPSYEELNEADFEVSIKPNIPADADRAANRAMLLFREGLADRETAMTIAGVENAPLVSRRLQEEAQNNDIRSRLNKVKLGIDLGIKREVLAAELGWSEEDLDEITPPPPQLQLQPPEGEEEEGEEDENADTTAGSEEQRKESFRSETESESE